VKQVTKGRRHTKMDVQVADDGAELQRVKFQLVTINKLPEIKAESLAVLAAAGVDPTETLLDSPHGSGLRDMVINRLDYEADSLEGLAARIYERSAHIETYLEMGAMQQAMNHMGSLGEIYTIFRVYRDESAQTRNARKRSKGRTRTPLRELLKTALASLRRESMTQRDSVESLESNGFNSLRLQIEGNVKQLQICRFVFEDENGDGSRETLTWQQLKELFKEAAPD